MSIVLGKNLASLHHAYMLKQKIHSWCNMLAGILKHCDIILLFITTLLRLIYNYISMGPGRKHKLDFVKWRRYAGDRGMVCPADEG